MQVEKDWMYKDLRCVVIMTTMGHRCGYVGIPIQHQLFGCAYYEIVSDKFADKAKDIKERPVGRRGVLDIFINAYRGKTDVGYMFDVHGGITYSGGGLLSDYPVESNLWWFGYDCNHFDDDGITLEYCIGECESLATVAHQHPAEGSGVGVLGRHRDRNRHKALQRLRLGVDAQN